MTPFANIVPNLTTQAGVLDVVAIITLLAYLIVGYFLLTALEGLIAPREEVIETDDYTSVSYHDLPHRKRVYKKIL
jgi:hypothetical protein